MKHSARALPTKSLTRQEDALALGFIGMLFLLVGVTQTILAKNKGVPLLLSVASVLLLLRRPR